MPALQREQQPGALVAAGREHHLGDRRAGPARGPRGGARPPQPGRRRGRARSPSPRAPPGGPAVPRAPPGAESGSAARCSSARGSRSRRRRRPSPPAGRHARPARRRRGRRRRRPPAPPGRLAPIGQLPSPSQGRLRKSTGSNGRQRPPQRLEAPPSRRATAISGAWWVASEKCSAAASACASGRGVRPPNSSSSTRRPASANASAVTIPIGPPPITQTAAPKAARSSREGASEIMRETCGWGAGRGAGSMCNPAARASSVSRGPLARELHPPPASGRQFKGRPRGSPRSRNRWLRQAHTLSMPLKDHEIFIEVRG